MQRGLSSADVVVIHTGKVVVDEGVGVDHLKGACGDQRWVERPAGEDAGGHEEPGSDSFSAADRCVPGGISEHSLWKL